MITLPSRYNPIAAKSIASAKDDDLVNRNKVLPAIDRLRVLTACLVSDLAERHPGVLPVVPVQCPH